MRQVEPGRLADPSSSQRGHWVSLRSGRGRGNLWESSGPPDGVSGRDPIGCGPSGPQTVPILAGSTPRAVPAGQAAAALARCERASAVLG